MKKSKQITSYLSKYTDQDLNSFTAKATMRYIAIPTRTLRAGATTDPAFVLKNFFRVSGYERNQIIKQLDSNIRQKGGTPTYPEVSHDLNSELSSNLSKLISNKDEQLLFTEIGRMKLLDIQKYQKVLNDFDFPEAIEQLLVSQKDTIVKSLYSIEVHKDLFAKKIVSFD